MAGWLGGWASLFGCTRPNDAGLVDSVGEQSASADALTRWLELTDARTVAGTLHHRGFADGPRLESVLGPEGIRPGEGFAYRLATASMQVPAFALLQWKYAASYVRIPLVLDEVAGHGLLTGIAQPAPADLSGQIDGIMCLEGSDGRPGPGIPITFDPADPDDPTEPYGTVLAAHAGSTLAVELFDRDGEHLVATGGDDATATLWNTDTGRLLGTLQGHSAAVTSLSASSDGAQLASGSRDNTVRTWDSRSGELLATFGEHRDVITWIAHSPDDRLLASGSWDGTVRVRAAEGTLVKTLDLGRRVAMIEFSRDGRWLAVAAGTMFQSGQVTIWSVADWSLHFVAELDREVTALNFSALSDRLVAAVGRGRLYVWDVVHGVILTALEDGPADTIPRLGFWPGAPGHVAVLTLAGTMFVWSADAGEVQRAKRTRLWLTSADFSSDGRLLALGDSRGVVKLVSTRSVLP